MQLFTKQHEITKNHEFLLGSQNLFEIKTQTIRMVEYTSNSKGLEKVQNFNAEAGFYFVCYDREKSLDN